MRKIIEAGHDEWREKDQLTQLLLGNFMRIERHRVYVIDGGKGHGRTLRTSREAEDHEGHGE
jgi:hypothetical protein